jgi:hypothetical protein
MINAVIFLGHHQLLFHLDAAKSICKWKIASYVLRCQLARVHNLMQHGEDLEYTKASIENFITKDGLNYLNPLQL